MKMMIKSLLFIFSLSITIVLVSCSKTQNVNLPNTTPSAQIDALRFKSKDELINKLKSKDKQTGDDEINELSQLEFFFEPKKVPESAELYEIAVKPFYCTLYYKLGVDANTETSSNSFIFEWFRTMKDDDLEKDLQRTGLKVVKSNKNTSYYYEDPDTDNGTMPSLDVYWSQDGYCFHACVPKSFTEDQILEYCNAKMVEIK